MLTFSDIAKLTQILATKQDLENYVTKDEFHQTMDKVFTRMDQVYTELKTMKMEFMTHRQEHDDVNSRLDLIESTSVVANHIKHH